MNYIDTRDGRYPLTPAQIVAENPLTSFTQPFSLCEGYAAVGVTPKPAVDAATQKAVELPPQRLGGSWAQVWMVAPLNADDLEAASQKLIQEKEFQWERIKVKRDLLSDTGGYLAAGKWFHSDAKSKMQQIGLMLAGANVPPVMWKTMDGSKIPMTQALAGAIFQAGAAQDIALFAAAEVHKAAMESSTTPLSYDFSGGWPATFGG